MLFSRFAQFTAALALLTTGLAAPVHAQGNLQIISGTWYEDRATAQNFGQFSLLLKFTQTPSNKFLNITNVSCTVQMDPSQTMSTMYLYAGTTSGASDIGRTLSIKGNATSEIAGPKYYSIITNQIYYKFGPGRFPTIEIDSGGANLSNFSNFAACVIVGNLTDN
jgi:hypothetical protein